MNKIKITAIVSVKNEEKDLAYCLERLCSFSQVIVVDSLSTDRTPEIVHSYGFELINFHWDGKYPKKRNWTLMNVDIKNDWVLFLDADEIVDDIFIEEIKNACKKTKHVGFWLSYDNYFLGKKLVYGDKMRKLALFRRDAGMYEKIDEDEWSQLDMEIHEHPVLDGTIGKIKTSIVHNDFRGLEHYIAKHNSYSSWEAHRFVALDGNQGRHLTTRQIVKYRLLKSGILPYIYFSYAYFWCLGFLDGRAGFWIARFKLNYFFQIQAKIFEQKVK